MDITIFYSKTDRSLYVGLPIKVTKQIPAYSFSEKSPNKGINCLIFKNQKAVYSHPAWSYMQLKGFLLCLQ